MIAMYLLVSMTVTKDANPPRPEMVSAYVKRSECLAEARKINREIKEGIRQNPNTLIGVGCIPVQNSK